MKNSDIIIFEHHDGHERGEDECSWYEDFIIYTRKGQKGYGYYYAVPYSEVTYDPNEDGEFRKDVDWEYFCRMVLDQDLRELLGDFKPNNE